METISQKKVIISYIITSMLIILISATTSMLGMLGDTSLPIAGTMSNELMALLQLCVVLLANLVLHGIFYYGGLNSAPLTKGLSIGVVLGLSYFMISVFALNVYDINSDPIQLLMSALSGRVIEYSSGGVLTAIISVTDIHKWGLLRAF
jgi:hypothetical protein